MESFSLKQCVFTEPEGKVDEVTQEEAAGGLKGIRFFLQTNQKMEYGLDGTASGVCSQESCVLLQFQLGYKTSNQFCIRAKTEKMIQCCTKVG